MGARESTGPARTDDSRVHGPLDNGSFGQMRTSRLRPARCGPLAREVLALQLEQTAGSFGHAQAVRDKAIL